MAVPVPSISCCVLNHHNLFYQMQSALVFNWDMCCHLALCLRLLPFHSFGRVLLEKGRKLMGENSSHIFNSRCGHACLSNVITPTQKTVWLVVKNSAQTTLRFSLICFRDASSYPSPRIFDQCLTLAKPLFFTLVSITTAKCFVVQAQTQK